MTYWSTTARAVAEAVEAVDQWRDVQTDGRDKEHLNENIMIFIVFFCLFFARTIQFDFICLINSRRKTQKVIFRF